MAYIINYSTGNFTINDGTLNTSNTSLALPGRNYAGFGQNIDQNFVSMLENFASNTSSPNNAIRGQMWYDTGNTVMKFNSSSNTAPTWVGLVANGSNAQLTSVTTTNLTTGGTGVAGSITGNWTIQAGSRVQATYADLAERFAADDYYEPGTVMELGGTKEITAVKDDCSERVFGVVSSTAAYLMNSAAGDDTTHPPIAMSGRVPVSVRGTVCKGDRLVSAGLGLARAARHGEANHFNTIGRALEDKTTTGIGKVLAAVSAKL